MASFDDDAEQGSVYFRTNGQSYQKFSAGTGTAVWRRLANADDLINMHFRGELVRALTSTAAPSSGTVIDLVAVPLGGDETPFLVAADFAVDEFILFGAGGTEKLMRVSVVSGDEITVVDPDAGFNPPCIAAAPNNANSSSAMLDITPKVYPEFNTKLSKLARVPVLLVLPILIASSISVADCKSGAPGSPPNRSAIDL
jgi:hypothetical protein